MHSDNNNHNINNENKKDNNVQNKYQFFQQKNYKSWDTDDDYVYFSN
jgi:hypothetical protein